MTAHPFIAAFDIATATGGCDGVPGRVPRVWSWFTEDAGSSRRLKLCYLRRLFDEYFSSLKVDAVYYEAPMNIRTMMRIGSSEEVIALLRGAIGVIESSATHAGIQIVEPVSVQDARQALTGQRTFKRIKGKSTAKDAIMKTATMLGVKVTNDNEGDAWAVWHYACTLHNPRTAHLGQALFARG